MVRKTAGSAERSEAEHYNLNTIQSDVDGDDDEDQDQDQDQDEDDEDDDDDADDDVDDVCFFYFVCANTCPLYCDN